MKQKIWDNEIIIIVHIIVLLNINYVLGYEVYKQKSYK